MQNTQQVNNAEYVINMIWNFMNHVRGNYSIGEIFIIKGHPNHHPFGSVTKYVFKSNYKIKK